MNAHANGGVARSARRLALLMAMGGGLLLAGCSSDEKLDPFAGQGSPKYSKAGELPKGGGRRHVGKPYTVAGRTFYPTRNPKPVQVGIASWYGPKFHRRMTSNGEWFDMNYLSAAHPTMPLPSYVRVRNLENGRTVVVRVNDRGPFVGSRIIDLSRAAADVLGFRQQGKARVRVEYLGPAPLGDDRHLLARLNRVKDAPKRTLLAAIAGGKTSARQGVASATQGGVPGSYYLQVASFSDPGRAQGLRARLASRYGAAHVQPVEVNGMRFWRVRVGPFGSASDAELAAGRMARLGLADARVVIVRPAGG